MGSGGSSEAYEGERPPSHLAGLFTSGYVMFIADRLSRVLHVYGPSSSSVCEASGLLPPFFPTAAIDFTPSGRCEHRDRAPELLSPSREGPLICIYPCNVALFDLRFQVLGRWPVEWTTSTARARYPRLRPDGSDAGTRPYLTTAHRKGESRSELSMLRVYRLLKPIHFSS